MTCCVVVIYFHYYSQQQLQCYLRLKGENPFKRKVVGAGNATMIIDETADLLEAARNPFFGEKLTTLLSIFKYSDFDQALSRM
ncbi:MAG: hypothetical protein DDT36_01438 [Firmicutes bacterium]|nr:hypothetical protein [Bacillota bacterium]